MSLGKVREGASGVPKLNRQAPEQGATRWWGSNPCPAALGWVCDGLQPAEQKYQPRVSLQGREGSAGADGGEPVSTCLLLQEVQEEVKRLVSQVAQATDALQAGEAVRKQSLALSSAVFWEGEQRTLSCTGFGI